MSPPPSSFIPKRVPAAILVFLTTGFATNIRNIRTVTSYLLVSACFPPCGQLQEGTLKERRLETGIFVYGNTGIVQDTMRKPSPCATSTASVLTQSCPQTELMRVTPQIPPPGAARLLPTACHASAPPGSPET